MSQLKLRRSLSAAAHILAEQVGLEGESYRTYMLCITGKTSCSDCTLDELGRFVSALQTMASGNDPDQAVKAQAQYRRRPAGAIPTLRQWETLLGLAASMGWSGLEDPHLLAFAQRTAHINTVHELTRTQISACITGLLKWQAQIKAKGAQQ